MTAVTERPHGYARYRLHGCRCYTCAFAVSQYNRDRAKKIATRTWQPFVPAAPVRAHLEKLAAAGIPSKRVAALAGVSNEAVAAILGRRDRPTAKVRPETAERILAITATTAELSDGALVDSTGSVRRIQALCAIGWPIAHQERQAGRGEGSFQQVLTRPRITAGTARAINNVYDQLAMTPAPPGRAASMARRTAERHEWPPPLAWDDDDIDNPAALPATTPANGEELLRAWLINYRTLKAQGQTRSEIAARLGTTTKAIADRLRRARQNGLLTDTANEQHRLHPCGTRAAYARHRRRNEPIDEACAAANRTYKNAHHQTRRKAQAPPSAARQPLHHGN